MTWLNPTKQWNFRGSSGGATDNANETFDIGNAYPQTQTPVGQPDKVTFGWLTGPGTADRSGTPTPEFEGIAFIGNTNATNPISWQVDLPGAGTYKVAVGMGDTGAQEQYWSIYDGATLVDGPHAVITTGASAYADSYENVWPSGTSWLANNVPKYLTFKGTQFLLKVGDPNKVAAHSTTIAHLEITQMASSTALMGQALT